MSPKNLICGVLLVLCTWSCSGAKTKKVQKKETSTPVLPADVFFGEPGRSFEVVGTARSWHEFKTSLDETFDEREFSKRCQQAFYQAAQKVLGVARSNGGEAVIRVRSVIFLADGRKEHFARPECVDDGDEGEALVEGQVIRWTSAKIKDQ